MSWLIEELGTFSFFAIKFAFNGTLVAFWQTHGILITNVSLFWSQALANLFFFFLIGESWALLEQLFFFLRKWFAAWLLWLRVLSRGSIFLHTIDIKLREPEREVTTWVVVNGWESTTLCLCAFPSICLSDHVFKHVLIIGCTLH